MDAEPPLDYLLDESGSGAAGSGAGREELLAIMARSRSQRHRLAALGMAATLAVGGAGGWLVAGGASSSSPAGPSLAAGATTTVPVPAVASASASASGSADSSFGAVAAPGVVGGGKLTKVFLRTTTDGVTIRGFTIAQPTSPAPNGCLPIPLYPKFEAEVSTADMTGQAIGVFKELSAPLGGFSVMTQGVAEGAPVWIVTAQVDTTVAQVRATFADGKTDQMAPVGGWVALAHLAPAGTTYGFPSGSIQILDKAGKVIDSQPFPSPPPAKSTVPPVPVPMPAQGGGVASAGVASSGTALSTVLPPKTVVSGSPPQTILIDPPVCSVPPKGPVPPTTTTTVKSAG